MPSISENHSTANHLNYIDGLKGIAILMVMALHSSDSIHFESYWPKFSNLMEHFSRGVHLFFIVSGYALFHSAESNWVKSTSPKFVFFIKRFFRILPLWWLTVFLYYFYFPSKRKEADLFATLFLYFGFFKNGWFICFVPVGWTLFVEESFYLFFPIWWKKIRDSKSALIYLIGSYLVAHLWYKTTHHLDQTLQFHAVFPLANYYAFFLGILLNRINFDFKINKIERISPSIIQTLNVLTLIGFIIIFFYDRMVGTMCLVPLIVSSYYQQTLSGKICRINIVKNFGKYCYSIYLFHTPIMMLTAHHIFHFLNIFHFSDYPKEIQSIIYFSIVAFQAYWVGKFSHLFIEKNLKKLSDKLTAKYNIA